MRIAAFLASLCLLSFLPACATAPQREAILPAASLPSTFLDDFQRSGGTGNLRQPTFSIPQSPANLRALHHVLEIAQARLDVLTTNIANSNTILDAQGNPNPYAKQTLTVDPAGKLILSSDPHCIRLEYAPNLPYADERGFVKYPAIDVTAEMEDALAATREFDCATAAINQL